VTGDLASIMGAATDYPASPGRIIDYCWDRAKSKIPESRLASHEKLLVITTLAY